MAKQSRKPAGKSTPKMHGGARANAGRKSDVAKKAIADFNAATQDQLVEWLPQLLKNLKTLADGGYERVEENFERSIHEPVIGYRDGEAIKGPPEISMELVERKVSIAEPDRMANIYLIDRLLGKPTERKEVSGPDGGSIPMEFQKAIADVYGEESG